ncbi:MAG: hypothetical protein KC429_06480, partial [Planktomarina temperata]|nr:hypothetical protein [Planktomarina temperata]
MASLFSLPDKYHPFIFCKKILTMLKIRDNQLHAFEALIKGKFLDDTTRYVIKENYPVLKGVSRPKVRERCDYSMKKAL